MAIKDFRFYLVPRIEVVKLHGKLPPRLLDYKSNLGSVYLAVDNDGLIYWSAKQLKEFSKSLSKIFIKSDSNYPETQVYSNGRGSSVQVDDSDVLVKFDATVDDVIFLEAISEMATKQGLLIINEETGIIIEPSLAQLQECFVSSRAYRFSRNPAQAIDETKARQ